MAFPLDPNAPGGPGRSEYVSSTHAGAGAPPDAQTEDAEVTVRLAAPDGHEPVVVAEVDGQPVATLGLRDGEVATDPAYRTGNILALLHLRRLEARMIMAVFGA
jgi:hypothetical protein